jgi:CheY-like chemotaxis protein
MSNSPEPILLVEDSPEDYEAAVRSFTKAGVSNTIRHCQDGDEALDYLFHRGIYSDPVSAPRPAVILLDLNLPGTDGREVLAKIKKDDSIKNIPVIVLTTSTDKRDIEACYNDGANSFIQKPVDLPKFIEAIQRLSEYWFQIALLPKQEAA